VDNITFIFKTFFKFIKYLLVKLLPHVTLSIMGLNKKQDHQPTKHFSCFQKDAEGTHTFLQKLCEYFLSSPQGLLWVQG